MTDELRAIRRTAYESPRQEIVALVPLEARHVLELGCSSGATSAAVKERQGARVTGVEIDPDYAADARLVLDDVYEGAVEAFLAARSDTGYDCLICADVLEHLVEPGEVLRAAVARLVPGSTVVVSLPNVLYWPEFRRVLRGDWPAEDVGVYDRTHLRWFTPDTARALMAQAGLVEVAYQPLFWKWDRRDKLIRRALDLVGLERFSPEQMLLTGRTV